MKNLKIVYLSKTRLPSRQANSKNVMKMCQAFARNGHRVVLMNYDYPDVEPGIENVHAFYGVDNCFPIKRLPRKETYAHARIEYHTRIKWLVRVQRPDVVVARDHSLWYAPATLGQPIILDAHKLIYQQKDIDRFTTLLAGKRLVRITTNCEALRRAYIETYEVPEALIQTAHNGADLPDRVEPVPLDRTNRLQVGYTGHLYPGKGMEIIAALATRCAWADFHILGGTDTDISYWKNQIHHADNLFVHGFLPHHEVVRYHLAMDVLLAPNQHHVATAGSGTLDIGQWTSPIKLFEYMAAGKAVMASDLPVIREVLTHNRNAYLCPPEDLDRWIAGLLFLRDHPGERDRLGTAAQTACIKRYTWQARARKVLEGVTG